MFNNFIEHININYSFLGESNLLIAISGGIDSVVLAHLCKSLNYKFALAHCNFNLRGEESNEDEYFVIELAEQLDVEVFVENFDTEAYAKEKKLSIQMAARELRYNWFDELSNQLEFDYVLTAHHADDNLETFLINFLRGTGINGLTGIPKYKDKYVRPLLDFSREEIEAYAKEHHIKWREDSSNSSRKYLRNKLRHEVVPILKEINPELLKSFQNTLSYLNDTADIVEESLNAVAKRGIVDIDENGIIYKVSEFKKVNNSKAYLFEMFKDFGFTEWNDVVNLLGAESGKYVTSNTHKLTKHREFLILTDCHSELVSESRTVALSAVEVENEVFNTQIGQLIFSDVDSKSENQKHVIYIDKYKLQYPLEFRQWKTGDIFYPLEMKGKKKLSKYLKDEKLTPFEKENTYVLTSEDKIIWVVGMRADDRFKVTKTTNQVLKIELRK
ncbi:MAG: tRNA lysidine(34) synthetase TilS [Winogradskyella sp.]